MCYVSLALKLYMSSGLGLIDNYSIFIGVELFTPYLATTIILLVNDHKTKGRSRELLEVSRPLPQTQYNPKDQLV